MKGAFTFVVAMALTCLTSPFIGIAEAARGGKSLEPGKIMGEVEIACAANDAGALVYIPGRSFVAITGPPGDFELSSVPPGTYNLHIEGENPASSIDLTNIIVDPGLTTNVGLVTIGPDLMTDPSNCGACGNACSSANGSASCTGGTCQISCTSGFADCNFNSADGCEAALNTVTHCGACGNACSFANANASCTAGTCVIGSCTAGFGNCDSNGANGCETALTTVTNCGACGNACSFVNANASCTAGTCVIGSCTAGFADCNFNSADGCEAALNTVTHCGACGNTCLSGQACVAGVCT